MITYKERPKMAVLSSICLLGAGNVAWHLGQALQAAGYPVRGVYSRTLAHARQLAELLDGAVAVDDLSGLPKTTVYVFAVKDDALQPLAGQLLRLLGTDTEALFVHTAGSIPLSVLNARRAAVLYPMMTFSKSRKVDFGQIPLFVEGSDEEVTERVREMALRLSGTVRELDSERRRLLHLSAVFANNFSNHCFTLAYRLLCSAGIDPHVLLPLVDETVAKLHDLEPEEAQTGPAVRKDRKVMERQMQALAAFSELQVLYRQMSESISGEDLSEI